MLKKLLQLLSWNPNNNRKDRRPATAFPLDSGGTGGSDLSPADRIACQAETHRVAGAVALAVEESERALLIDAACWRALRVRALLHQQAGDLSRAEAMLTRALEVGAPFQETYRMRALTRLSQGLYAEALADCESSLQAAPDDAETQLVRGIALFNMSRLDEARAAWELSDQLKPEQLSAAWNRANMELNCGMFPQAIDCLDRLIERVQSAADAPTGELPPYHRELKANLCGVHLQLARAYASMNQHERAFAELTQSETFDPRNLLVYEFRAQLHMQRDDYKNALADCDRLVRIAPCDDSPYTFRARVCLESGDIDGALADLDQAELFATEPCRIRGQRGQIFLHAGRIEEARAAFDDLLADKPDDAFALYLRSQCWQSLGVFGEQRDDVVAALALEADNPLYLNSIAWLYSTCPDEAVRNGEQALALSRKAVALTHELNPHYLDTLAAVYAELGQLEQACQVMRQAISLFKMHPPPQGLERYRQRLSMYERGEAFRD